MTGFRCPGHFFKLPLPLCCNLPSTWSKVLLSFFSVLTLHVKNNLEAQQKPWRLQVSTCCTWYFVRLDSQGFVNGGFQMVVRVLSGEQIPLPPFNPNLTPFLPQLYLFLTSFLPVPKPQFNLCFVGNVEPWFGNHGLQTLGTILKVKNGSLRSKIPLGRKLLHNKIDSIFVMYSIASFYIK